LPVNGACSDRASAKRHDLERQDDEGRRKYPRAWCFLGALSVLASASRLVDWCTRKSTAATAVAAAGRTASGVQLRAEEAAREARERAVGGFVIGYLSVGSQLIDELREETRESSRGFLVRYAGLACHLMHPVPAEHVLHVVARAQLLIAA